jgi:hypothetical protein
MKAAQIDVVERTAQLLAGFNLSTAAPELGPRLESAGNRDALLLVLEVLEMEAEAREQRKITRLRRAAQIPPGKTFETLDASTLPAPLMRKLRELARGESWKGPRTHWRSVCREWAKATALVRLATRSSSWDIRCCSVPPTSWCRNCSPQNATWCCRRSCVGWIPSSC